jgi:predicted transcriptional regulator
MDQEITHKTTSKDLDAIDFRSAKHGDLKVSRSQLRFLSVDDLVILAYLTGTPLTITAIAEKMHLTQPAVTQRIRKMESALGQKLVERSGRGVQLTVFGMAQADRAAQALNILDGV